MLVIEQSTFVNSSPNHGLTNSSDVQGRDFGQFGKLYKHCMSEHLPRTGGTIRIGTLSEYRRIENLAVQDQAEGRTQIELNFAKPTFVHVDALRRATRDTLPLTIGKHMNSIRSTSYYDIHSSGSLYSTDNVEVISSDGERMELLGNVSIEVESADAHILSMTRSCDVRPLIQGSCYDAIWSIKADKVSSFAKRVTDQLHSLFCSGEATTQKCIGPFKGYPGFAFPKRSEATIDCVICEIHEIEYRSKVIELTSDIGEEDIARIYDRIDRSGVIKPIEFKHEVEVRLLFRPALWNKTSGKYYLFPCYLSPVFLPFAPILDCVEIVHPR